MSRVLLSLILCVALLGCSTNARVHLKGGRVIAGGIAKSTSDQLWIKSGDCTEMVFTRDQVEDIDHPGLVPAIVGTVMTVAGGVQMGISLVTLINAQDPDPFDDVDEEDEDAVIAGALGAAGGGLFLSAGMTLMIVYWIMYGNSTRRADAFEAALESPTFMVLGDPLDHGALRIGMGWRF